MLCEYPEVDPRLAAWLAEVDYYWRRRNVPEVDRLRLRAELEHDSALAVAQGASVQDVISAQPSVFAEELAEADGVIQSALQPDPPMTTRSFIGTALLGAVLGAVVAGACWYLPGGWLMETLPLTYQGEGVFAVGLHTVAACICAAGAALYVRWRFRFRDDLRRIVVLTGTCLLLSGAASVVPTMALASSLNYRVDPSVVLLEVGIVFTFCVTGLGVAHWILARGESATERLRADSTP